MPEAGNIPQTFEPRLPLASSLVESVTYPFRWKIEELSTAASAGSEMQACVVSGFPREAL